MGKFVARVQRGHTETKKVMQGSCPPPPAVIRVSPCRTNRGVSRAQGEDNRRGQKLNTTRLVTPHIYIYIYRERERERERYM